MSTRIAVATRRPLGAGGTLGVAAILVALAVGGLIASGHTAIAAIVVVLVPVALAVSAAPHYGLCAGIAVMLLVPYGSGKPGALLALATVAVAVRTRRARRLTFVDVMLVAYLVGVVASWAIEGSVTTFTGSLVLSVVTPLAFYLAAREVGDRAAEPLLWTLLLAGAVAAATLFVELFIAHRTLFVPEKSYLWNATSQTLFRPGGVLRSPPGAADVLTMTSLAALPLLTRLVGWKRVLAGASIIVSLVGVVATLDRASMVGIVVGGVVYLLLSGSVRVARLFAAAGAVIAVLLLVAIPVVGSTAWYHAGFLRQGTLAARESYWADALPAVGNSPEHLALGHGINSLEVGRPSMPGQPGSQGEPDPDLTSNQLLLTGTHNQYIRTLFEQGVAGAVVLAGWLVGSVVTAAAVVRRRLCGAVDRPIVAGAAAAIVAFMVESAAVDSLREEPTFAVVAVLSGLIVAYARRPRPVSEPEVTP